jgi:hypothetical protein
MFLPRPQPRHLAVKLRLPYPQAAEAVGEVEMPEQAEQLLPQRATYRPKRGKG